MAQRYSYDSLTSQAYTPYYYSPYRTTFPYAYEYSNSAVNEYMPNNQQQTELKVPPQPYYVAPYPYSAYTGYNEKSSQNSTPELKKKEARPHQLDALLDTPAFSHHLKNHNKYDTVRSGPFKNCQICKAMLEKAEVTMDPSDSPHRLSPNITYSPSAGRRASEESGKNRVNNGPKEMSQEEFLTDMTRRRAIIAKVIKPRTASGPKEMSVTIEEYLEVLDKSRRWWECKNAAGQTGFVPDTVLTVKTSSLSAPELFRHRPVARRS